MKNVMKHVLRAEPGARVGVRCVVAARSTASTKESTVRRSRAGQLAAAALVFATATVAVGTTSAAASPRHQSGTATIGADALVRGAGCGLLGTANVSLVVAGTPVVSANALVGLGGTWGTVLRIPHGLAPGSYEIRTTCPGGAVVTSTINLVLGGGGPATTTPPAPPTTAPSGGLGGVISGVGSTVGGAVGTLGETLGGTVSGATGAVGDIVTGVTGAIGGTLSPNGSTGGTASPRSAPVTPQSPGGTGGTGGIGSGGTGGGTPVNGSGSDIAGRGPIIATGGTAGTGGTGLGDAGLGTGIGSVGTPSGGVDTGGIDTGGIDTAGVAFLAQLSPDELAEFVAAADELGVPVAALAAVADPDDPNGLSLASQAAARTALRELLDGTPDASGSVWSRGWFRWLAGGSMAAVGGLGAWSLILRRRGQSQWWTRWNHQVSRLRTGSDS